MIKEFNVGVKGVVRVGDKCIVLKTINNGEQYWGVPGGRIDGDESIEDTLRRELSEELPTLGKYKIGDILSAYRLDHDLKDGRGLLLIFYRIDAERFEVKLSNEHSDFKWVTKDELIDLKNDPNASISVGYYEALNRALSD